MDIRMLPALHIPQSFVVSMFGPFLSKVFCLRPFRSGPACFSLYKYTMYICLIVFHYTTAKRKVKS